MGNGTEPVVADYTYVSTTTRDTSRMLNGYWAVKNEEAEIPNFQEEYGIGNDQAAFIGVQISVVYSLASGNEYNWVRSNTQPDLTQITGYDATKTQVLKNVSGTFTWVDEG